MFKKKIDINTTPNVKSSSNNFFFVFVSLSLSLACGYCQIQATNFGHTLLVLVCSNYKFVFFVFFFLFYSSFGQLVLCSAIFSCFNYISSECFEMDFIVDGDDRTKLWFDLIHWPQRTQHNKLYIVHSLLYIVQCTHIRAFNFYCYTFHDETVVDLCV